LGGRLGGFRVALGSLEKEGPSILPESEMRFLRNSSCSIVTLSREPSYINNAYRFVIYIVHPIPIDDVPMDL
jgi:hypothetical protein